MQQSRDIRIFSSPEEFERRSAEEVVHLMKASLRDRGICNIVLSGGETPRGIYRLLGTDALKRLVDWSRVNIFFSDERPVAPDDPQSNYGMVRGELTSRLEIAPHSIHRIRAEFGAEKAALEYEEVLRTAFDPEHRRFDVVLLGIGSDGHTASLFPSTDVLTEGERWARAVYVPHLNGWRVTLTFRAINSGREVLVFASGASKASIVERALTAQTPTKVLPITMVQPVGGSLRWRLDQQAASIFVTKKSS
jgi:6-phosphogluconolactonase